MLSIGNLGRCLWKNPGRCGRCFLVVASGLLLILMVAMATQPALILRLRPLDAPLLISRNNSCSFEIFKEYISKNSFFPSDGAWAWTKGIPYHFKPTLCTLSDDKLSPTLITRCLLQKKITRLLIMGDSQGKRDFWALQSIMDGSGFVCEITKKEKAFESCKPDIKYYVTGTALSTKRIKLENRGCSRCLSTAVSCTKSTGHLDLKVHLEYLCMEYYHDVELTSVDDLNNVASKTTQEFYFKEYLQGNYPDAIFLFGNNDLGRANLSQHTQYVHELAHLLQENVPTSTLVVWIPSGPEYRPKKPARWRNVTYENGRYYIEGLIRNVNRIVFNTLKPVMTREHSNFLPFLDLQGMASEQKVLATLSLDGVHMKPVWYEVILSALLETLCESDLTLLMGRPQT